MTIYIISRHKWPVLGLGTEPLAHMKTIQVRILGITRYIKLKPFFTFTTLNPTLNFKIRPLRLPSRPAFSIEYDRAQPVIKFLTLDHNSSILNQMNLI